MKEQIQKLRQKYVDAERKHFITFKEKSKTLRAKVSVLTELLNIISKHP